MTKREIASRYKGSIMGILWSLITPIFMLCIYTLVFSIVFKARWSTGNIEESKTQFALTLFAGLIVYSLFAEIISKAPTLITSNPNYVKKIVFPLESLTLISILSALFHFGISLGVLLIAFLLFNGYLHWSILWIPVVFLPLIFLCTGLSWLLSSLGVFIRDIHQIISLLLTVVMFLSPIFYPVSALPIKIQPILMINPLTFIIEQSRAILIYGQTPNLTGLALYTIISLCIMWLGFAWFQKTRKGFADVL